MKVVNRFSHNCLNLKILPSLELPILSVVRLGLKYTPLQLLGRSSLLIRYLLEYSLSLDTTSQGSKFDILYDSGDDSCNEAILFLHGGAFSLCDSVDIMVCERLIAYLKASTDAPIPTIYSICYDILPSSSSEPKYLEVLNQVISACEDIRNSGRKILCLIGDSAGANLALNVARRLQISDNNAVGGLCLISPWVDLYSRTRSYEQHKDCEMIELSWLQRSRDFYVGDDGKGTVSVAANQLSLQLAAETLANYFVAAGVKVVVFDMDQCAVAMHSRGFLQRKQFPQFAKCIREDFIELARALHRQGVKLAVATHSDAFEYHLPLRDVRTHIMGEELAAAVLHAAVPELQQLFKIVAYNPRVRGNRDPRDAHKKRHLREIAVHYGVATTDCILFDDDTGNVEDTEGLFSAYQVDPAEALRLTPALLNAVVLQPPLSMMYSGSSSRNDNQDPTTGIIAGADLLQEQEQEQKQEQEEEISSLSSPLHDVSHTILTDFDIGSHDKQVTESASACDPAPAPAPNDADATTPQNQHQNQHQRETTISRMAEKLMRVAHYRAVEDMTVKYHHSGIAAERKRERERPRSPDEVEDKIAIVTENLRNDLSALSPILFSKEQLQALPPTLTIAGGKEVFIDDISCFYARICAARLPVSCGDNTDNTGNTGNKEILLTKQTVRDEAVSDNGIKGLNLSALLATGEPKDKGKEGEEDDEWEKVSNANKQRGAVTDTVTRDRLLIAPVDLHAFPVLWRHIAHRLLGPIGLTWLFELLFPYRAAIRKARLQALERQYGVDSALCKDPSSQNVHSEAADEAIQEMANFISELRRKEY